MADKIIKSVNLLPEFLRTSKNSKFLSSTLDQLIQKPQLERVDGYIGSTLTVTYSKSEDIYIKEDRALRRNYQLEPSLVVRDESGKTLDVVAFDDLVNEIAANGGKVDNLDRLFRSEFYSLDPHIDWDKFVNYQEYYWLPTGPDTIDIPKVVGFNVENDLLGEATYTTPGGLTLSNGMKIRFDDKVWPIKYRFKEFYVEGVGSAITLTDAATLLSSEVMGNIFDEVFDGTPFDTYPFDNFKTVPLNPEYVTINRSSQDLNPWSRYNRWFHKEVIRISAEATGQQPVYPIDKRAKRPIIEFKPNIKLFNFGSEGISNVDFVDTKITDAFAFVEGAAGHHADSVLLEEGSTIIFPYDTDPTVRQRVYRVKFVVKSGLLVIKLVVDRTVTNGQVCAINNGLVNKGTSWWFNGTDWVYAQQRTTINQAPLFDLFDKDGFSYSNTTYYATDFQGTRVFGYDVGTGTPDPVLGFPLRYRNSVGVGSYLFRNYFNSETIIKSTSIQTVETISTAFGYLKIGNNFFNVWSQTNEYEIPILTNTLSTTDAEAAYYELPLGLTNNPLNGPIESLTLSDVSDHVKSMIQNNVDFDGTYPGTSNLRDLPSVVADGKRLIANINPMVFANMFVGRKEHSVISAISKAADQYNQFKLSFLKKLTEIDFQLGASDAVDLILKELNSDKDLQSPYYLSDMVPYGSDKAEKIWTVRNPWNVTYPLSNDFNLDALSLRAVLVYHNDDLLVYGRDYTFTVDTSIELSITLAVNDTIKIAEYKNTVGSFVPSTPTKLGLYPKFIPEMFTDNTYLDPVDIIRGHDGSLTVAYGDFRDAIILELEKRIYNNIKVNYRPELFDINEVIPGAFRDTAYSLEEIIDLLRGDFAKWAGTYGVNYQDNSTFDVNEPFTYNYSKAYNQDLSVHLLGSWRAVYKFFYDTDSPHLRPWEMLGLSIKPDWWETEYGTAPYTSTTPNLWNDLEQGYLRGTDETRSLYARPGLSALIPVDGSGNLLDPVAVLASNITDDYIRRKWKIGEQGPAETAWRRSSYWPFALQKILALAKPAKYCALMFDTSRMNLNLAGQWTYGDNRELLKPSILLLQESETQLTAGYSVFVIEAGLQRSKNYLKELQSDLDYTNINLFYKVGGFVSKDKLQIVIDSIDPTSIAPGAILPYEDYNLIFNTSNPIKTIGISGIIIQKVGTKFVVKGYDVNNPYFTVYTPIRNQTTQAITVGGKSEPYLKWESSTSIGDTGLTDADTTTANSVVGGKFYNAGQIVEYANRFYRVKTSHRSGNSFQTEYFQVLPSLPITGGATVQSYIKFNKTATNVPYGTEYGTLQEVYDLIIGYGAWLEDQGFVFDEFNSDLNEVINWNFTGKEFLFWTTQKWASNSVITLSPFADQIKYKLSDAVVDNIFNSFYDYHLLQANGITLPESSVYVDRDDGVCTIKTRFETDGIYFAKLRAVQKEHGIVFNNSTIFNDTVYDIETGYRQRRMKVLGFRTGNWNGDYFSPGFVYDSAIISDWTSYTDYKSGDIIRFDGNYYAANSNLVGTERFDFNKWTLLGYKPVANLLPNFDYKINQFEDFYSLDIDNFDSAQQAMAQHLTGYTPRVYLNNILKNPVSQYKFYQGFIREKGTRNSISRLAKASVANLQGEIDYTEEWAFRVGHYGSYETYKEIELPLVEGTFIENPQIINFVDRQPVFPNDLIYYSSSTGLVLKPDGYVASSTFLTTSSDVAIELNVAGYVRFDDVDAVAPQENDLLAITENETITRDDVIWVGDTNNGNWDVVRYVLMPARIRQVGMFEGNANQILFTTNIDHGLLLNDIVSIIRTDSLVNGVYRVSLIPEANQFVVNTTVTTYINDLTLDTPGMMFKFISTRFSNFDSSLTDIELLRLPFGSKLWCDNEGNGTWVVYEKTDNYELETLDAAFDTQDFGFRISKQRNSSLFMVSDPGTQNGDTYGLVSVYEEQGSTANYRFKYSLNNVSTTYHEGTYTNFGYALAYDDEIFRDKDENNKTRSTDYGLLFVGAPITSKVKSTEPVGFTRYALDTYTASGRVEEGVVKISSIDPILIEEVPRRVLCSPYPSDFENFGASLYVGNANRKMLAVGAPQTASTGTGTVYVYWINTNTANTVNITFKNSLRHPSITARNKGAQWGYSIVGTNDASTYAISAPGWFTATGLVAVYSGVTPVLKQTIQSPFRKKERFGESMAISSTGEYLFISAIDAKNSDRSLGKVAVYQRPNAAGTYTLIQTIVNPIAGLGMKFGQGIDLTDDASELVITALGTNNWAEDIFDNRTTIEDFDSTTFYDNITYTGMAYVYNRKLGQFKLATRIKPDDYPKSGTNYGFSVAVNKNSIYVGAPSVEAEVMPDRVLSRFYKFYKTDTGAKSWNKTRYQEDLVVVENIQKITLIDAQNETIVDYLDVVDPIKGKIPGTADQDLKYKSSFDPAVYSIGTSYTVNDTNTNWLDDHVGELWWDVSTAKYVWYEQGDLEYRKNNWGRLFPGSTVDIYEWVGTEYLPSEWSVLADTTEGLAQGISGQPKYADNSVLSVKQIYNALNNSFSNYYFYWVKNKVTIPNVKNRRVSAYQIASIIANPTLYGLKFAAPISKDAVILSNVGNQLIGNRIHLNLSLDIINNTIPRHTEWLLLQEGSPFSVPNALLEKKLFDSLLGRDSLGNPVPDPTLSERARYGIGIRPRQSLFKDRLEALRNLIEFANSVFVKERITGNYSFKNLNLQEQIPSVYSYEYDSVVEDNEGLLLVDTDSTETASITCSVKDGRIINLVITNPGLGYRIKPKVTITSLTGQGAEISTEIDDDGKVISAEIVNAGQGYADVPTITVRPFTVIVQADAESNGKWAEYVYDKFTSKWIRIKTQSYNTPLYWNYIDWSSNTYNPYVDYTYTVESFYDLDSLTNISVGQYVKVNNNGLGNFIILNKSSSSGTFGNGYDVEYIENGTIQIDTGLWDYANNNLGFDQSNLFDQSLFSQTPDIELGNILRAIKDDLFVNDLKINWNLFFFKAVKYALSEQKLLDWAFKTSFISVTNYAGELDQRPIYKLKNSSNYEDYIREVKPYHTNIRSFTENYTITDPSGTYVTDFDLPSYYNTVTGQFEVLGLGDSKLDDYPWKSWSDNYTTSGTVRTNLIGLRFDRTTRSNENLSIDVVDRFKANGVQTEFVLSWLPLADKASITATIDGAVLLTSDYNLIFYTDTYQGYSKKLCKILFTSFVPVSGQVVNVAYKKSSSLLNAYDRIVNYYTATSGMPGSDPEQLMSGIEYPKTQVIGLPFDASSKWDKQFSENYFSKFDEFVYFDDVRSVESYNVVESSKAGTDTFALNTVTDIKIGQTVNLVSHYGTLKDDTLFFNKLADPEREVRVLEINTITNTVKVDSTITNKLWSKTHFVETDGSTTTYVTTATLEVYTIVENSSLFDSSIIGGAWTPSDTTASDTLYYQTLFGIDPSRFVTTASGNAYLVGGTSQYTEDIIIDGDGFITPNTSYAPEELVPGEVHESLGINVYTKNTEGAPTILSSYFYLTAGTTSSYNLTLMPPNASSIYVTFDNQLFDYTTSTNWTATNQYTIDWETQQLIVAPQTVSGNLGYLVISIGGESDTQDAAVIDSVTAVVNTISDGASKKAQLTSLSSIDDVGMAYVTVNGSSIPTYRSVAPNKLSFVLGETNTWNRRASVEVRNLNTSTTATITAWFFGNEIKHFNEAREQYFTLTNVVTSATLSYPPGDLEPVVGQVLVELNTVTSRLLKGPLIGYWKYENSNVFAITTSTPASFNYDQVRVYLNGNGLRPSFDYTITGGSNIIIDPSIISIGDAVSIVNVHPSESHEFDLTSNILTLTNTYSSGQLRVITFNNHDTMFMRTERFMANPSRRYKISRPVLNERFVWVSRNGIPLISFNDFEILDDMVTVQISDKIPYAITDEYVVTSFASEFLATTVLGYRIFNDIFNRTHFKRLSKKNTTYLVQPLTFTDTEIHVADASVLTKPIVSKNIPGVVIIDGERIEFFKITGNVLSQLRRSTLGTAPAWYSEENSKVIDQGNNQTVPFKEKLLMQTTVTNATKETYVIYKKKHTTTSTTGQIYVNDGIKLSTSTASIGLSDQVAVFYGGRPLNKVGSFYHDINKYYDSPVANLTTQTVSTKTSLPITSVIGTSYIVEDTNEVWTYYNSKEVSAFKGYEYRGLRYRPPEFTINPITQEITLNILEGIGEGIKLTVVKRETSVWNDEISSTSTESLMTSETAQARFLQASPAELPDKYYYGGDPALEEDSGLDVTDDEGKPLEGF